MKKLLSLLFAAAAVALFTLTGCAGDDTFTEKTYTSGESVVTSVSIDVSDRQIDIGVSDDDMVHIDYFDGEKEYFDIAVQDGALTVKLVTDKSFTDFIGTKAAAEYRKVTVRLPKTVESVFVSTTNETVKVSPIAIGKVAISNNGGNIEIDKLDVKKSVELSVKNGSIKGSVVGGWDDYAIECEIKKGDSNLPESKSGGEKSLKAKCNNGDINIEFVNA